jgi:hypothetical protein
MAEIFGHGVPYPQTLRIVALMTREGHIATLLNPKQKEIARGTLRGLIKSAGLSVEEFIESNLEVI